MVCCAGTLQAMVSWAGMKPVVGRYSLGMQQGQLTAQPLCRTSLRNTFHGSPEVNLSRSELQ